MTMETHLSLEEVAALKETFRAQAMELLEDYGRYVLDLEQAPEPGELLKSIQRVVHTLKGDSMSLEFDRLAELAHRLEDLLASIRDAAIPTDRVQIDLLLACGDAMNRLLDGYCAEPPKPPISIASLLDRLDGNKGKKSEHETSSEERSDTDTTQPLTAPTSAPSHQLRMDVEKIDRVMNLVGELVIGRSMVSQALSELAAADEAAVSRLTTANNLLERTLTELQTVVLKIRMIPVDHVFRRFPRVVRDLAIASGKEVELEIHGASTELDKSIVDTLHEPLLHLVRNAIDHGIESPEARVQAGKRRGAKLTLAAFYEGNHVHILIEDDGVGIDVDKVRERAVELGLASRQEIDALHNEDVLNFIFQPGFSTKTSVSTVSGRGIGMDVVRGVIESLKGTIDVKTEAGRGTQFLLRLPLTLAILKAILVESAGRPFAFPLSGVIEIVRLFAEEAGSVLGKGVMRLRDRVVPLVDLKEALQLEPEERKERKTDRAFVILVGEAERRVGLVVDRLLGEYELVVKPIEDPLLRSPGIAGASILGDGKVVLILNLRGLSEKKRRTGRRAEGLK